VWTCGRQFEGRVPRSLHTPGLRMTWMMSASMSAPDSQRMSRRARRSPSARLLRMGRCRCRSWVLSGVLSFTAAIASSRRGVSQNGCRVGSAPSKVKFFGGAFNEENPLDDQFKQQQGGVVSELKPMRPRQGISRRKRSLASVFFRSFEWVSHLRLIVLTVLFRTLGCLGTC